MNNTKTLAIVAVFMAATLVVGVTFAATATQAFAAKNLNSSKSNIYRQSTSQSQSVNEGSAQQESTSICNCPSNDITVINNDD
jgi:outer membrane lipoprotein-sorting protein